MNVSINVDLLKGTAMNNKRHVILQLAFDNILGI